MNTEFILILISVFVVFFCVLFKIFKKIRQPRYMKFATDFLLMLNGESFLRTVGKTPLTISYHYSTADKMFFKEDGVNL